MKTSHQIKVIHSGVTVTYNERDDKWQFTLRGRDRSADSLSSAKASIDKPVPAEKAKPFQKVDAWYFSFGDIPEKVKVTGVAESMRATLPEVWISAKEGRRKVAARFNLFQSNETNDAIINQMKEAQLRIDALREEISNLKGKLAQLVIEKGE